jgi:flagellar export protein FliJ
MAGKKFQFRLEAVLKLRHHETEIARKALGQATMALDSAHSVLARAEAELNALLSRSVKGQPLPQLRRSSEMRSEALGRLEKARQAMEAALKKQQEARRTLADARLREEALGNLKTQQREAFDQEIEELQQRMLDELGVLAHSRAETEMQP